MLEPGAVRTRPVRIHKAEFQRALLRLVGEVRLGTRKPREATHELLSLMKKPEEAPLVESWGVSMVVWTVALYSDGQRWHLPWGKSVADIPAKDKVGDMLQEAVTRAASEWGPHRLSRNERDAIAEAERKGEYWLARLLEREARGRFVHETVKKQFQRPYRFNHQGVDVVDLETGRRYEILSGTESNLARHGRRMAGELFRMLTF